MVPARAGRTAVSALNGPLKKSPLQVPGCVIPEDFDAGMKLVWPFLTDC